LGTDHLYRRERPVCGGKKKSEAMLLLPIRKKGGRRTVGPNSLRGKKKGKKKRDWTDRLWLWKKKKKRITGQGASGVGAREGRKEGKRKKNVV